MIRQFLIALLLALPVFAMSQNKWEWEEKQAEHQAVKQAKAKAKAEADAKYLKGAVTESDGKVVFTTTIDAQGKSADDIYDALGRFMQRLTHESNQMIQAKLTLCDSVNRQIVGAYEEWLVFTSNALSLDRSRFYYLLTAKCSDGKAIIEMSRLHYLYEEERTPQRMTAEEWITDKEALNKKGTKLLPYAGKFRRKTIDRKDYLFQQMKLALQ